MLKYMLEHANTIIAIILLLFLFFAFFSITFRINFDEVDENPCNHGNPDEIKSKTTRNDYIPTGGKSSPIPTTLVSQTSYPT
jgi:hypothetical protein